MNVGSEENLGAVDKADPELNREQTIEEAEQIISAGDKVDPELSPEQLNQEAASCYRRRG